MIQNQIRVLSVALIENNGKYLAALGYDKNKDQKFYRAPGGGVEFGETSVEALKREMLEEFAVEVGEIELLEVVENIFQFEGRGGHEICFIYKARIVDQEFLNRTDKIKVLDNENVFALWVNKPEFKETPFYPEGILKYIS